MNSSPFPERSMFEYIISIYLPGSLVAIVFLYAIEANGLANDFIKGIPSYTSSDGKSNDFDKNAINNLLLALYAFYFISAPFIFGALVDGFRHCISECCRKKFSFLNWNYPNKEGYKKTEKEKLSENIYSRQVDKSYLLYHAYEFYGNFISAILTGWFIYFLSFNKYVFLITSTFFTIILCVFSMYHFWKENNRLSNDWGLYGNQKLDESICPKKLDIIVLISSLIILFLIICLLIH